MKQIVAVKRSARLIHELKAFRLNHGLVIGIDEAGRGPLAGPVSAAAVAILDMKAIDRDFDYLLGAVRDSKKLPERKREEIYEIIIKCKSLAWGSALVSEKVIDRVNILEASKIAMAKAVSNLGKRLGTDLKSRKVSCLIDGNFAIDVDFPQTSIIGGDAKVFSISAASIIAKVRRDRLMVALDKKYPGYGFLKHKGYPTSAHRDVLNILGVCPAHRMSFAPCAAQAQRVIIKS